MIHPDTAGEAARFEVTTSSRRAREQGGDVNHIGVDLPVTKNLEERKRAQRAHERQQDAVGNSSSGDVPPIRQELDDSGGGGAFPSGSGSEDVTFSRKRAKTAVDRELSCAALVKAKKEASIKTTEETKKRREEYKELRRELVHERAANEPDDAFIAVLENQIAHTLEGLGL